MSLMQEVKRMDREMAKLIECNMKEKINATFTVSDAMEMTKVKSNNEKYETYVIEKNNFLFVAWIKSSDGLVVQTTALPVYFVK